MPRLRRIVIVAKDPGRLAEFYREVLELKTVKENQSAIVLSDGVFSLALLPSRSETPPGLHSFGFEVESIESVRERLTQGGMALSLAPHRDVGSDTTFIVNDPDGNVVGISESGFGISGETSRLPIRHIALFTPNTQRLADFYTSVFAMKEVSRSIRSSIFVSDGSINLALLLQREDETLGFHHFGFHVKSNEEIQKRAEKAGGSAGARRPNPIPFAEYRLHDPEGNGFDISEKGWDV